MSKVITKDVLFTRIKISDTGCWEFTGAKANRYGVLRHKNKTIGAHRLSWIFTNGSIPSGLFVCHKCDNTICINPEHLFLGTPKDNMRDMFQKGRRVPPYKGGTPKPVHCKRGHQFTYENTIIRKDNTKSCRICTNAREAIYQRNKRAKAKSNG